MDTIYALASGSGKAGVSIIRVSGPRSPSAAKIIAGTLPEPRYATFRRLRDVNGEFLDEGLVLYFEGNSSFTGEPVVEFQIHGSVAVVQAMFENLSKIEGCRPAEPGEFTRRALENGKLDLTQVEALADLIDAETEYQRRHAYKVLSGALGQRVGTWRQALIRASALLEALIDFADEDIPDESLVLDDVIQQIDYILKQLESELSGLTTTERVKHGFEVAIVGPPNAGKSTLLNYLAGREASITSEISGTTRDIIEVRMDIGGIPVTLLDTAGLRETDDQLEALGIAKAKLRASDADIRIHLVPDGDEPSIAVEDSDIVIQAKQDNEGHRPGISGLTGNGVDELLNNLKNILTTRLTNQSLISRERHKTSFETGHAHLIRAKNMLISGITENEVICEDLRLAIKALDGMLGYVDVEDLLEEIFSSFCIGK